jgi:hypothetical protein
LILQESNLKKMNLVPMKFDDLRRQKKAVQEHDIFKTRLGSKHGEKGRHSLAIGKLRGRWRGSARAPKDFTTWYQQLSLGTSYIPSSFGIYLAHMRDKDEAELKLGFGMIF